MSSGPPLAWSPAQVLISRLPWPDPQSLVSSSINLAQAFSLGTGISNLEDTLTTSRGKDPSGSVYHPSTFSSMAAFTHTGSVEPRVLTTPGAYCELSEPHPQDRGTQILAQEIKKQGSLAQGT